MLIKKKETFLLTFSVIKSLCLEIM